MEIPRLITILGPTASGKTKLATLLANEVNAEIISADSRQVYKDMTIGTGKDLQDYCIYDTNIPYHLIDIAEPYEEYNVFRFKQDFMNSAGDILNRGKEIILCGGTGLYIDSVLKDYQFLEVPPNISLREKLEKLSINDLAVLLLSMKKPHLVSDIENKERLIRAIEIETYSMETDRLADKIHIHNSLVFGILLPRDIVRSRISERLKERLEQGMIEEVKSLIDKGITIKRLLSFGLEYKFVTLYLTGKINYAQLYSQLETAIHQFSKRQMTWFRRMERIGISIIWIDGLLDNHQKVQQILNNLG
jgi:tRNA dimethylallyltransferase